MLQCDPLHKSLSKNIKNSDTEKSICLNNKATKVTFKQLPWRTACDVSLCSGTRTQPSPAGRHTYSMTSSSVRSTMSDRLHVLLCAMPCSHAEVGLPSAAIVPGMKAGDTSEFARPSPPGWLRRLHWDQSPVRSCRALSQWSLLSQRWRNTAPGVSPASYQVQWPTRGRASWAYRPARREEAQTVRCRQAADGVAQCVACQADSRLTSCRSPSWQPVQLWPETWIFQCPSSDVL